MYWPTVLGSCSNQLTETFLPNSVAKRSVSASLSSLALAFLEAVASTYIEQHTAVSTHI